jgi:hypothetical protein
MHRLWPGILRLFVHPVTLRIVVDYSTRSWNVSSRQLAVHSCDLWPTRSPLLIPPDFFLWGLLNMNKPRTRDDLKGHIRQEIAAICALVRSVASSCARTPGATAFRTLCDRMQFHKDRRVRLITIVHKQALWFCSSKRENPSLFSVVAKCFLMN